MRSLMCIALILVVILPAILCGHEEGLSRPMILEYGKQEEVNMRCSSWRFAVEANNLNAWKTIPQECADYIKNYMMGKGYALDLQRVSNEASVFATTVRLQDDRKDAWLFDIDETLLSNLPYYANHGFGLEVFDAVEFDKWVVKAMAPAIEPSLRLYEQILSLGFKIFLLTGRSEKMRDVTAHNLINVGFKTWDKLIFRDTEDHGKLATTFKSEKRNEMMQEGFRILGNSGDQWSDLLGFPMSTRSFKLPNPMYYIP